MKLSQQQIEKIKQIQIDAINLKNKINKHIAMKYIASYCLDDVDNITIDTSVGKTSTSVLKQILS